MQRADEALKTVAATLERYRKNKTMVSPADLTGRYAVPFRKLKEQLCRELEGYLKAYCLEGLVILNDAEGDALIRQMNAAFLEIGTGRKVGRAAFKDFDLAAVRAAAQELRQNVRGLWRAYFDKHTCLYVYGECFAEDAPNSPLIYNQLVDKFLDETTGKWTGREKPPGDAILIFAGKDGADK